MKFRITQIKVFVLSVCLSCVFSACQDEMVDEQQTSEITLSELQFREEVREVLYDNGYESIEFIDDDAVIVEGDIAIPLDKVRELYKLKQLEEPEQKSAQQRGYKGEESTGIWWWKKTTYYGPADIKNVRDIKIRAEYTDDNDAIQAAIDKWNRTGTAIHMRMVTSGEDILIKKGGNGGATATGEISHDGKVGSRITLYNGFNGCPLGQKTGILMHELGHNLSFSHTDEETLAGTYHIEGTPTASETGSSSVFWSGSSSRSFNNGDLAAIHQLYFKMDASVRIGNYMYFFIGKNNIKYNFGAQSKVSGYPRATTTDWPGMPFTQIDAAVKRGSNTVYFFSGSQYTKYNATTRVQYSGYPRSISGAWNINSYFNTDIDAALCRGSNTIYFFKGDKYTKYNVDTGVEYSGYPHSINWGWKGNDSYLMYTSNIDAAVNRDDNYVYFYKDKKYIKYSLSQGTAVQWTVDISRGWPGVSY